MFRDLLDRVLDRLDTEDTRRALDERVLSPLLKMLYDRYSSQFAVIRNAFLFIAALLFIQLVVSVIILRRVSVGTSVGSCARCGIS